MDAGISFEIVENRMETHRFGQLQLIAHGVPEGRHTSGDAGASGSKVLGQVASRSCWPILSGSGLMVEARQQDLHGLEGSTERPPFLN